MITAYFTIFQKRIRKQIEEELKKKKHERNRKLLKQLLEEIKKMKTKCPHCGKKL